MPKRARFPQFNRLPPEIRNIIWSFSLPSSRLPTPYLYSWRWYVQYLDPDSLMVEFEGVNRQIYVRVPTPAALFVNHESRAVALAWANSQGLEKMQDERSECQCWCRPWDLEIDPLWLPHEKWEEFVNLQDDWDDGVEELGRAIKYLAIPAFTAYFSIGTFAALLDWMPNLEKVFVVWEEPPRAVKGRFRMPQLEALLDYYEDVQCEAEVQPRWCLDKETRKRVRMGLVDDITGEFRTQGGDLDPFMKEIYDQMAISEIPEQFYDTETGTVTLEFVPVRMREERPWEV